MDEAIKMYAMSAGDPNGEPGELDPDKGEYLEEDDDIETAGVHTSSDDDEVVAEESVLTGSTPPTAAPAASGCVARGAISF